MTTAKPELRAGMRLTVAEFLELPADDQYRWLELDDGELYIMPRPRRVHQFLKDSLVTLFRNHNDHFPEPPAEVYSELVVILSREPRRVLVPDLAIVLTERANIFAGGYAEGPPDIVIEVLSSDRDRDLTRKRRLYAEAGVPEYWIFDPVNDTALPLELQDGDYVERGVLSIGDTLATALLPGLAIPLADLFQHRQRPRDEA